MVEMIEMNILVSINENVLKRVVIVNGTICHVMNDSGSCD